MLSSWDDYPVHQVAEPIRFVGTSDRNFYDRYYFNGHACSDDLFFVIGMGQYPNLGTQDAFVVVRRGDKHRVVRASRELDDRMDLSVGPFGLEITRPLEELRLTLDDNEHGISFDLTWTGTYNFGAALHANLFARVRFQGGAGRYGTVGRDSMDRRGYNTVQ